MTESAPSIAPRLTQLGFSQYEARTYVGLLMSEGATGYSVANDTGVPQPKVYETLRWLVQRGAAVLTSERPGCFEPLPATRFGANARLRFEGPVVLAGGRRAFASDHLAVEADFTL